MIGTIVDAEQKSLHLLEVRLYSLDLLNHSTGADRRTFELDSENPELETPEACRS
jgi:hypothetical protein